MRKLGLLFLLLYSTFSLSLPTIEVTTLNDKAIDKAISLQVKSLQSSKPFNQLAKSHPDKAEQALVNQLKEGLKPYGYFKVKVLKTAPWHFSVQLNQRVKFQTISVSVTGEHKAYLEALLLKHHLPKLKPGESFSSKRYQQSKNKLLELCERHGFIKATFAKAEVLVDLKHLSANVTLVIDPGKRYYFGNIQYSKSVYPKSFLDRYAPFDKGTPYSQEKLLTFEQNLQNAPYFSSVAMTPESSNDNFIPIVVNLKDAPKQQYLLGGGYGTDTGFRGRAGVLRLFENGHSLQTELQLSQRENNLQAQYLIPGAIPYKEQFSLNANIFHMDYEVGTSDAGLLSIKQLKNDRTHQFEAGLNLLYEDYQYTDRTETHSKFLYPSLRYSKFKLQNPLFSKEGYSVTLKAIAASKSLLSDENLVQGSLDLKAALWVKQTSTRFFFRGTAGITETSNIYNIPLSLQQLLGGANNLDAYQYQSIGPGELLLFGRAELQQETKKDWFVTVSYAAGDVYHPNPFNEKRSIGVGLMYASPIGLIKAGVAKALDLTGEPVKLIFSMGPDL